MCRVYFVYSFLREAEDMQANRRDIKVYVQVSVVFREDGAMLPRSIVWEDGRKYSIDRVLNVRPAYAERAGGQGDRYTVMVGGQQRYLFFEHSTDEDDQNIGRWFIERKERET